MCKNHVKSFTPSLVVGNIQKEKSFAVDSVEFTTGWDFMVEFQKMRMYICGEGCGIVYIP